MYCGSTDIEGAEVGPYPTLPSTLHYDPKLLVFNGKRSAAKNPMQKQDYYSLSGPHFKPNQACFDNIIDISLLCSHNHIKTSLNILRQSPISKYL